MSDLSESIDLKFLPDWLKESSAPSNPYANFEGEPEGRRGRDRDGRPGGRGPRGPGGPGGPGGNRGPRPGGPGGGRPENRGPRPPRPDGPRGERRGGPGQGGPGGRRDDRGSRRGGPGGQGGQRGHEPRPERAPVKPANVKVEFLPEIPAVTAIAKEIKVSHRAFPLFGTARLFLDRPERHRVRLTAKDEATVLYQLGEGLISTDRAALEREAFRSLKDKYYREDVQQGEAPKGNFANVARLRASGLILGPTNHHAYQPTLRRIYEERYSRRMSFADFQQYEVEVVKDEQVINDWKEQSRSITTWHTTQEAEEQSFKTPADVEAHFRQHYLPNELKSGPTFETNGSSFRHATDRSLGMALREEFDRERGYPVNLVNAMRPVLNDSGLHFFKHRKRIVFISPVRPHRHPAGAAQQNVLDILKVIDANPRVSRPDLAMKMLGEHTDSPDLAERKTALATDLHYLILAGHVIEFSDGRLDLPLPPKAAATGGDHEPDKEAEMAAHRTQQAEAEAAAATSTPAPAPAPVENAPAPEAEAAPEQQEQPAAEIASEPAAEEAPAEVPDAPAATVPETLSADASAEAVAEIAEDTAALSDLAASTEIAESGSQPERQS